MTLFGAAVSRVGWAQLDGTFEWLADSFADCTSYVNEVVAAEASGDLAYLVAIEHTSCTINGALRTYELRATTIFRREDGKWRIVHRHGSANVGDQVFEQAVA